MAEVVTDRSNYARMRESLLEQARQEDGLPLRNEACRSKFFLHSQPTSTVFLFLHGFTAGPYQFEPLGQALYQAGHNVLVPLQPGHGLAGEWSRRTPPPLPTQIQVYQDFVLTWLKMAQSLGQTVVVGGLSSGGTLAGWVALHYPQTIRSALLFAPFLGSHAPWLDGLIRVLPFYFEWFNKDASGNWGYEGFRIPALRLFLTLGHQLLRATPQGVTAPMLVVASEADQAASLATQRALFTASVRHQRQSWYYCFDQSWEIGHRMMTEMEDNDHEELVITLAKAYVDSQLSWPQLNMVAQRMRQGEPYDAVIQEMQLQSVVSPCLGKILGQTLERDRLNALNPFSGSDGGILN